MAPVSGVDYMRLDPTAHAEAVPPALSPVGRSGPALFHHRFGV